MKISSLFPTRFISADDLIRAAEANKDRTEFEIVRVVQEDAHNPITNKDEKVPVVYFRGALKGHRLRKSEHKKLIAALGEDAEQWIGKTCKLIVVDSRVGKGVRLKVDKES